MLDWSGETVDRLGLTAARTTLLVLDRAGAVRGRFTGDASAERKAAVFAAMEQSLDARPATATAR
jgi:hypothetical protein